MAKHEVKRHALLIGVPQYDVIEPDLPVVTNDLQILDEALKSSRFDVRKLGDKHSYAPTRGSIRREMRQFCAEANEGDTLLLYFSGHGVHYTGRDYLIPSDATLDDPINVQEYLIPADLSEVFDECKAQTILFFIDACREGIEIKDSSKGLAKGLVFKTWSQENLRLVAERESAIVFSCAASEVSRFAQGDEFSFFTKALAEIVDPKHPAQKFREVTEALQERLNELTDENNLPRQLVKVRAEYDRGFRILEREICDGSDAAREEVKQAIEAAAPDTHQAVSASCFLERPDEHENQVRHACVLFAELFGSTEYKMDHPEINAINKIVLHNEIVSDLITNNGGLVVKHVVDRVMGVFEGRNCEKRALSTSVAIIRKIDAENGSRGLEYPNDLKTSIGVESGYVRQFRFDSCGVEDYQGRPVDIAGRLCLLAGLQQLICGEDTFQRVQIPDADWNFSDKVDRFVEGLDDPFPVRLVVPREYELGEIQLSGFIRPVSHTIREKLNKARQCLREKRSDDAFRLYHEILDTDRSNFEANVCCAEIEMDRLSGSEADPCEGLNNVIHKYLCRAKLIRPQSNLVWRLLGCAYYTQGKDSRDPSLLSTANDRAMMALTCAQDHMDVHGELAARILLASILREQARFDASRRTEYLAKANEYCGEVAYQVVGSLDRIRSNHLGVQALIQFDLGVKPSTVETMLEEARAADPRNPRVHQALAEFYRAHRQVTT